ncbi:MAG: hypothetical protein Q9170_002117 [Blastenia crenularia]
MSHQNAPSPRSLSPEKYLNKRKRNDIVNQTGNKAPNVAVNNAINNTINNTPETPETPIDNTPNNAVNNTPENPVDHTTVLPGTTSTPTLVAKPNTRSSTRTYVYIAKALEGYRIRGEAKVAVHIIGAFQNATKANDAVRRWLRRQWPDKYDSTAVEEVIKGGGIRVDMLTHKDDGAICVDVERREVT